MPNEYVFTSITSLSFVICMVFTSLIVNFSKYRNSVFLHLAYNLLSFMQIVISWWVYTSSGSLEHSVIVNNSIFILSSFCLYASTGILFNSKITLWPLYLIAFIAVSFIPLVQSEQVTRILLGEFLCVIIPLSVTIYQFRKISIPSFRLYLNAIKIFISAHFSLCLVAMLGLIEDVPTGGEYYRAAYYFITLSSIFISFTFTKYIFSECFSDASTHAKHDYLTGLYSRRFIKEYYDSKDQILVFGLIDVDNFKHCNDTYGHLFGDYLIKFVSKAITDSLPIHALVGRFGGDEFVFVFEFNDAFEIEGWFEKLNENLSRLTVDSSSIPDQLQVTASCGVTVIDSGLHEFEEAISEADALLYAVKRNGKNSVLFSKKMN